MDYFLQIRSYLEGTLSAEETSAFEHAMAEDQSLKEAVELFPVMQEMFTAEEEHGTRQAIAAARKRILEEEKEVGKEVQMPERKDEKKPGAKIIRLNRIKRFARVAAAASVILLGGAFTYSNIGYTDAKIVESAYTAPDDPTLFLGEEVPADAVLKEMFETWNAGDRKTAIQLGTSAMQQNPDNTKIPYHTAHFLLQEEQYEDAIDVFEDLYNDLLYGDEAKYQSALAHIAQGEIEEGKALLQMLSADQDSRLQDESEKALRKLNSPWRKLAFN